MSFEQFANNVATTLTQAVDNTSNPVTLNVSSGAGFPSTGQFRVIIDNEILLVTSGGGTTAMTASRNQEGTLIATHSIGAVVYQVLTAASLSNAVRQGSSQSVAYSATVTPDASAGSIVILGTLTGNITINNATNPLGAQLLTFEFTQDGTGGRTVTWGAAYKTAFQPNQTASSVSSVSFFYDGTNWQQLSAVAVDTAGNVRLVGSLIVASGGATISAGGLTITGSPDITMTDATSRIVPGATSLSLRNNANSSDNVLVADAGNVTIRGNITSSAAPATLSLAGAGTTIIIGGTTGLNIVNNANNANNIAMTDAGAVTLRALLTVSAGGILVNGGGITATGTSQFNSELIYASDLRRSTQSPSFTASYTPSATAGEFVSMTLTGAITVNAPTGGLTGQKLVFIWTQDGTGGRVITYNAVYKTTGSGATTALSTTASTVTIDQFYCVDGTNWRLMSRITGQT